MSLLVWAASAWARAGGGQNYGGSGGGGSGGGGYGGGGGDLTGLVVLLGGGGSGTFVFVLLVIAVVVLNQRNQAARAQRTVVRQTPARPVELGGIRQRDPAFSRVLFLDHARLVVTRALHALPDLSALGGLIGPAAAATLRARRPPVVDVIFGAMRLNAVSSAEGHTHVRVFLELNLTEGGVQTLSRQMWTFSRPVDARSPTPDGLRALRCPQCGSALATRPDGRCAQCETPLDADRLPWSVSAILVVEEMPVPPIALTPGGGMEVGTDLPTLASPSVRGDLAALAGRHPDATWPALQRRFIDTFVAIQKAWSTMRWQDARPHETDMLYQQHRYWIERYRREGLQNHMADLQVTRVDPVRVELDRHVSVVVVRIFATARDWTADRGGNVVSGSEHEPRRFSEYWTFLRSAEAKTGGDAVHCPSCGAALDRVGESGVCGYCDSQVTTGEHGWVLAMIDQDEAWRG